MNLFVTPAKANETGLAIVYIALGSNLEDRKKNILRAVAMLSETRGVRVDAVSTILETRPLGIKEQPDFINAVVRVKTNLDPFALRDVLLEIERRLGRVRIQRWGPRQIDLDILYFGDNEINHPALRVPHPQIVNRPFIQNGLRELGCPFLNDGLVSRTKRPHGFRPRTGDVPVLWSRKEGVRLSPE